MDRVVGEGQAPRRFNAVLVSAFAAAAVLLALLGIYSVIAFSAVLRTQEMAIRLALGSQRSSVIRLILVSGAKLGLAGCGIGAIGAVLAARLMRSMLFRVDPIDPAVIALSAFSILLLALAASVIPARRAASVEPMEALRGIVLDTFPRGPTCLQDVMAAANSFLTIEQERPDCSEIVQDLCGTFLTVSIHAHKYKARSSTIFGLLC
jgi:predicted lysophospholipase L1 biosynthesis ABC-type transport system permease subunit